MSLVTQTCLCYICHLFSIWKVIKAPPRGSEIMKAASTQNSVSRHLVDSFFQPIHCGLQSPQDSLPQTLVSD